MPKEARPMWVVMYNLCACVCMCLCACVCLTDTFPHHHFIVDILGKIGIFVLGFNRKRIFVQPVYEWQANSCTTESILRGMDMRIYHARHQELAESKIFQKV